METDGLSLFPSLIYALQGLLPEQWWGWRHVRLNNTCYFDVKFQFCLSQAPVLYLFVGCHLDDKKNTRHQKNRLSLKEVCRLPRTADNDDRSTYLFPFHSSMLQCRSVSGMREHERVMDLTEVLLGNLPKTMHVTFSEWKAIMKNPLIGDPCKIWMKATLNQINWGSSWHIKSFFRPSPPPSPLLVFLMP